LKPEDNTTEYTVVWRTMKYSGEWMEDDNLTMMSYIDSEMLKNFTYGSMVRIFIFTIS
jgi:hypothetical protein